MVNARATASFLGTLCVAVLLDGCSSVAVAPSAAPDPAPGEVAAAPALSSGAAAFERRLRAQALLQQRDGHLGEAAVSWEILAALRPDNSGYRERWIATRRQIDAAVPERLQRAQQAWKRGEFDAAATQFLAVLALQPDNAQAADALRAIERERNKTLYLGKQSRITLARSGTGGALRTAKPTGSVDSNDIEHAALLRTQGEIDAAIALLERYVAARGPDATACRMLGELLLPESGAGRLKLASNTAPAPTASSPCP